MIQARALDTLAGCPFFFRRYHAVMTRRAPRLPTVSSGDGTAEDLAAARVLRQFRQIFNAVKTHFQQVEKKVGLGGAQVWALSVIRDFPDVGMSRLAESMNIHQSTASNLVKGLVERGLVSATKRGVDRRAVMLRLLPAGARILKRSPGPFAGVLPEALASLDRKTLTRLEADLKALIGKLDADTRAGRIPLAEL
jgi:DNA-binding MarR family transcriptional regulator